MGELSGAANPEKAEILSRFFKTGKGQYGEGDVFLGITVPVQRRIAKKYSGLELPDLERLLSSKIHEHRLVSLLILVEKFRKGDEALREEIVRFYLDHTGQVNNWDLVDLSAEKILGEYLAGRKDKALLSRLARSGNLWERRIAIMATFAFIKRNRFDETLRVAGILLPDPHDLIHKAVGWMLREVGKRDMEKEESFLRKYHGKMPRTMLRYAVERFDEGRRKYWLLLREGEAADSFAPR